MMKLATQTINCMVYFLLMPLLWDFISRHHCFWWLQKWYICWDHSWGWDRLLAARSPGTKVPTHNEWSAHLRGRELQPHQLHLHHAERHGQLGHLPHLGCQAEGPRQLGHRWWHTPPRRRGLWCLQIIGAAIYNIFKLFTEFYTAILYHVRFKLIVSVNWI